MWADEFLDGPDIQLTKIRGIDMAYNRDRDQGLREGIGGEGIGGEGMGQQGGGQHAPSRNPQGDRSVGGQQKDIDFGGQKPGNPGRSQQGGIKRGDGRSYKETGPSEETTQR